MTSASPPPWKVTSTQPRTEFIAGVGPVEGQRINYQTNTGISGFVFIANTNLSDRTAIAAAIQTDVEHLHAINTMTSGK